MNDTNENTPENTDAAENTGTEATKECCGDASDEAGEGSTADDSCSDSTDNSSDDDSSSDDGSSSSSDDSSSDNA